MSVWCGLGGFAWRIWVGWDEWIGWDGLGWAVAVVGLERVVDGPPKIVPDFPRLSKTSPEFQPSYFQKLVNTLFCKTRNLKSLGDSEKV